MVPLYITRLELATTKVIIYEIRSTHVNFCDARLTVVNNSSKPLDEQRKRKERERNIEKTGVSLLSP